MLSFSEDVARRLLARDWQVVVTGAGGWLGMASLEMLDAAFGSDFHGAVRAYGSFERDIRLRSGRVVRVADLASLARLDPRPSLVLHFAYVTNDKVAALGPERFIAVNNALSQRVVAYAAGVPEGGIFFPSSGARYRGGPYGVLKGQDETRMEQLRREDFQVAIFRIFNLAGPFINKVKSYALSSILSDIERGGPVVLNASHRVFRSYVHVRDVIDLAVALLVRQESPQTPIDTAGNETIEIGDLAKRATALTGHAAMTISRPPLVEGEDDRYVGDGAALNLSLAKMGISAATLDQQILDTAAYLRDPAGSPSDARPAI